MKKVTRAAITISVLVALWYIGSLFSKPMFIPSPLATLDALGNLFSSGQLMKGILYSFLRITIAAAISMSLSIPIAILVYGFQLIRDAMMPVISFLRYLPVTAFGPLLTLWAGIGELQKILFLFVATFLYLLPSVLMCFDEVPTELMDHGLTIGMSKWEAIREILIPASLPSICSTFLMMYAIGWTYVSVVESNNAKYGLGYIIQTSAARGRTSVVFAAIITIILVAVIFDKAGNKVIDNVFKWRRYQTHD